MVRVQAILRARALSELGLQFRIVISTVRVMVRLRFTSKFCFRSKFRVILGLR